MMETNPYAPPQARTDISAKREAVPRPISVWLMMALLLAVTLLFIAGISQFVGSVLANWGEVRVGFLVFDLAWRLGLVAAVLASIHGLYHRQRWSRWLAVSVIAAFAGYMVMSQDTTDYADEAERAGGTVGRMVIGPLLFCWWAYALAFSSKARRYFSKPVDVET